MGMDVECCLLAGAWGLGVEKAGRAVAAQIGDDDAIPGGGQRRRDIVIGVHVVRKAVHQHDRLPARRAALLIGDLKDRGADGLHVAPTRKPESPSFSISSGRSSSHCR